MCTKTFPTVCIYAEMIVYLLANIKSILDDAKYLRCSVNYNNCYYFLWVHFLDFDLYPERCSLPSGQNVGNLATGSYP